MKKTEAIQLTSSFLQLLKQEDLSILTEKYDFSAEQLQEIKNTLLEYRIKLSDLKIAPEDKALSGTTLGDREIFDLYQYDNSEQKSFGVETILWNELNEETELTLLGDIEQGKDGQYHFIYKLIEVQ